MEIQELVKTANLLVADNDGTPFIQAVTDAGIIPSMVKQLKNIENNFYWK